MDDPGALSRDICNIFSKGLKQQNITFPVAFIDGYTSYASVLLSNSYASNGVELDTLYPNLKHLLQPMNVAVKNKISFCANTI